MVRSSSSQSDSRGSNSSNAAAYTARKQMRFAREGSLFGGVVLALFFALLHGLQALFAALRAVGRALHQF